MEATEINNSEKSSETESSLLEGRVNRCTFLKGIFSTYFRKEQWFTVSVRSGSTK